jgi:hypothetical protein
MFPLGKQAEQTKSQSNQPREKSNSKNRRSRQKPAVQAIDANAVGIGKGGPFEESPLGQCGIQQNRRARM